MLKKVSNIFNLMDRWLLYVVVRSLNGHKSNCTAVDFHPFGEFFASGSLDTNLKIWDIRKKGNYMSIHDIVHRM
jgi:WD40 repeat protein